MELKNIGSWRLNKTENQELQDRVGKGEEEHLVKREIQTRKAKACAEQKLAATAIADKAVPKAKAKAKSAPTPAAATARDPTNSAYYGEVEADIALVLEEFPAIQSEPPLALSDGKNSGVQEPYHLEKGQQALELNGVYRASGNLFWVQLLASPTPGIPMSQTHVLDIPEYYFPKGSPAHMTGRMVELSVDRNALTTCPENLQMCSPEELVHSMLAACATMIRSQP